MNSEYIFNTIIPPCLVIFGIVGNFLCLLVFRRKRFKRLPLNFLFCFMTITDNIALLTLLQMFFKYSTFHFDITIKSTATCKLLTYVQYFVPPIKGWILVIIAIERYFSVINPRRSFFMKSLSFQYKIIVLIFVFNMSYNLPYLIDRDISVFNTTNQTIQECRFRNRHFAIVVFIMHVVNTATMPFTFMIISTVLVIIGVYKSKYRVMRHSFSHSKQPSSLRRKGTLTSRDIKFSFTSIVLNLLFLCFNLPLGLSFFTIIDYDKPEPFGSLTFAVTRGLYYLSFATPILIYLITNSMFRSEFLIMLMLNKRKVSRNGIPQHNK